MKNLLTTILLLCAASCQKKPKLKTPEIIMMNMRIYKFTPGLFSWPDFQKLSRVLDDTSVNYACINEVCGQVTKDTVFISIKK